MGTSGHLAGPLSGSHQRYELPVSYGSPASRRHDRQNLTLPPIRTIGLDWGDSSSLETREACYRDSTQLRHRFPQIPAIHGTSSASVQHPILLPSPVDSRRQTPPDYSLLDKRNMLDGDFDDSTEGLKRRALDAHNIIHRYFSKMSLSTLRRVTCTVDANRPLFGSDLPKTRTTLTTIGRTGKRGKTSKHSKVEQLRREAHAIMLAELGKRACDAIMELAGYKVGSRKPPGKNHLHLAAIFQIELDSLIDERAKRAEQDAQSLKQHDRDLEHHLHDSESSQAHRYCSSHRRRSVSFEDNDFVLTSPRKRQRLTIDDTVPYEGLRALAWQGKDRLRWSEDYHTYDSAGHHGECSDYEAGRASARPRQMFRPRHQQHSSLPSPAPSTTSS